MDLETITMIVEVTASGLFFYFFSVETTTMIVQELMIVDVVVAANEIMRIPLAQASGIHISLFYLFLLYTYKYMKLSMEFV